MGTHNAYFRLPWPSDRLAFGTSADGDCRGRDGSSSGSTRWNAIAPRRRGRGFSEYLGLAPAYSQAAPILTAPILLGLALHAFPLARYWHHRALAYVTRMAELEAHTHAPSYFRTHHRPRKKSPDQMRVGAKSHVALTTGDGCQQLKPMACVGPVCDGQH